MLEGKAMNVFSKQTEDLKNGHTFKLKPWDYLVYSY